ncbi:MAG: VOC family protein [Acidobacteriota bacterium]|nr:VOC family protein [Acidobacteriota bacterium]
MAATNATDTRAAASRSERLEPRAQKITTFLWFDNNAEEAVNFYVSIFKNSKVLGTVRNGDAGPGPKGSVLTFAFQLDGQEFTALNGGPHFKFTEAISLVVHCDTQEEVDYFWEKLSAGGEKVECGWLKDKFGLSWQIVPDVLLELLQDNDTGKSQRVMHAMMKMKKLEIEGLKQAANETEK